MKITIHIPCKICCKSSLDVTNEKPSFYGPCHTQKSKDYICERCKKQEPKELERYRNKSVRRNAS